MNLNALEVTGVTKTFPGATALDHVSLTVHVGEVHGLVGENGAGKSTLIKIISGALAANRGSVQIGDVTMSRPTPRVAQSLGVRVIHQERQIAPDLTVAENIMLDRLPAGRLGLLSRRRTEAAAAEQLEALGINLRPATPVRSLSVAQHQLIELARAVSFDARLVIMDEPTASLHRDEVITLFEIVRRLQARGVAVLFISHHLDEVFAIADRVTVLRDGRVAGVREVSSTTPDEVIGLIFGKDVGMGRAAVRSDRETAEGDRTDDGGRLRAGPEAVVARGVCYRQAVRNVTLTVAAGEILAITGAQGSGASELAQLLAGALVPTEGTITHASRRRRLRSRTDHTRHGIAYLPADRKRNGLLLDQTVRENILLSRLALRGEAVVRFRRNHRRAVETVRSMAIKTGTVDAPIRVLSGGNQQKTILGRWLEIGSTLLVFDEPTAGVDISSKLELYHRLVEVATSGAAVVFVSSDYEEIAALADRVIVMRDGRVVGEMPGDQAEADRLVRMEIGA